MRELNEQELEQVAGGVWAYGSANAGSAASLKKGTYGSFSSAGVLVTPKLVVAEAENATFATGKFSASVTSGAATSAEIVR